VTQVQLRHEVEAVTLSGAPTVLAVIAHVLSRHYLYCDAKDPLSSCRAAVVIGLCVALCMQEPVNVYENC